MLTKYSVKMASPTADLLHRQLPIFHYLPRPASRFRRSYETDSCHQKSATIIKLGKKMLTIKKQSRVDQTEFFRWKNRQRFKQFWLMNYFLWSIWISKLHLLCNIKLFNKETRVYMLVESKIASSPHNQHHQLQVCIKFSVLHLI